MQNGRDILDSIVTGAVSPAGALKAIVDGKIAEDQWLDFKHGDELAKPGAVRNRDLLRWTSAFANAEGGVLVYGVGEEKDAEGNSRPKGGDEPEEPGGRLDPARLGGSSARTALGVLGPNTPDLLGRR